MSVSLEVLLRTPWVLSLSTPEMAMPSPIWMLSCPPEPMAPGIEPRMVWASNVWNVTRLDLKPVVLTLAMLLEMTSIMV